MDSPADWISETELAAATGAVDRKRFHRNLLNWRHRGLLPERYHGILVADAIRHLGFGVGNEACYPPVYLPIVRRINELRRQSKDMDEWRWQLWLDGYPVDIIGWCRGRLELLAGALAAELAKFGENRIAYDATRTPTKRANPLRIIYRVLRTKGWHAMIAWAVAVAIGARSAASFFDPARSPLAILTGEKDVTAAQILENMAIDALLAVLDAANEAELERVREDCRVIARPSNSWSLARLILTAVWRRIDTRAVLLPGLIAIRSSPGHQGSLADALGETEVAR